MRITRGTDVGLRVLMLLARSDVPKVSINQLAADLNLPDRHVGKIVQVLSKYGWVATVRGRAGGVIITPAGLAASADTILTAIEGDAPLLNCYDPPCPFLEQECELRKTLGSAQAAFRAELAGRTIGELAGVTPPTAQPKPGEATSGLASADPDPSATSDQPEARAATRRRHRRLPAASSV